MIHKAKFENFKGLRDVEVTFDSRFTVLVGPNGTGKTSVLEGVELAAHVMLHTNPQAFSRYVHRRSQSQLGIILLNEALTGYKVEFPDHRDYPGGFRFFEDGTLLNQKEENHVQMPRFDPMLRPRLDSECIARPVVTKTTPPEVSPDGTGMTAMLAYLKLRDDEVFDRTESELGKIVTSITKIRIDEIASEGGGAAAKSFLFDTPYGKHIPAEQMSDGTLYILALIVAVLGPHRPKTLLIDDIDMRLHPKAQYELVTLLKKFLEEFPDLQIIATSHSPYILDKLEPNEVRVTGLGEDGSVVIAPLTDHPSYEKWKDSMTPGEFWSHTGEEWLKKLKRETVSP